MSTDNIGEMKVREETPQEKDQYEQLMAQAREIVQRVTAGTLTLNQSTVVDDHLFVYTGDEYLVFPPEGNIGYSPEPTLDNVNWHAAVHMGTLENTAAAFTQWLAD